MPINGIVKFDATVKGSIVNYECNEGCILSGVVQRVCNDNGQWSGNAPQCKSKLITQLKWLNELYCKINNIIIPASYIRTFFPILIKLPLLLHSEQLWSLFEFSLKKTVTVFIVT